jgi:hydroxymethylpyrimidine kinase/phosphomethylpyrimidine kinase/thiamine-phosphate diphosphorylase
MSIIQNKPIVYTIAGSDSGGGAGLQADVLAISNFHCHACTAITCVTAQNSVGVTHVHAPPASVLKSQLDALLEDLPPVAVKIGMLGSTELVIQVAESLQIVNGDSDGRLIHMVLDPVMISTSGHRLLDKDAQAAMVKHLFPLVDIVTPNKFEVEALLGRQINRIAHVEQAARELIQMGCKSVLIKGGHSFNKDDGYESESFAQDYFLSDEEVPREPRLCDGPVGVWLRTKRYESENTHGTGCTLSSAIASALALGESERRIEGSRQGSVSSIRNMDACCLAKAYVTAGIHQGQKLGSGPGPVAQTKYPDSYKYYPSVALDPARDFGEFLQMKAAGDKLENDDNRPALGRILPIVDTVEWVETLCKIDGVKDIQFRIKDALDKADVLDRVQLAQKICQEANVRLWINDYWQVAVEAGCFGVHVGQEDLYKCVRAGGLNVLRDKNMALGISTHSYAELSVALGVKPTYISLGPVFATSSKSVSFDPQGIDTVTKWRQLIPPIVPLVAIGGIGDAHTAARVLQAGADCVAVIGAITHSDDPAAAFMELDLAVQAGHERNESL